MKGKVDPASVPTEAVHILNPDGTLTADSGYEADLKALSEDDLRQMYRYMVVARRVDAEATNLQRQGELGVYVPSLGQEAAQVGAAYALGERDWIVSAYREIAMAIMRGVEPADFLHMYRGTWHGGTWDPWEHHYTLLSVPVGTQTLHGTGFALASKLDKAGIVVLTCMGDGATSEGDWHEGLNFAGVFKAPVVFLCQNNQYAISVPVAKQTAAPTIAVRALGYGFPGVRVDGNDVLASYCVTKEAARRARDGGGPTLIEAITYRMGPHSTADDPTRYRTKEEMAHWEALDPIRRFALYLEREGALSGEWKAQVEAEGEDIATRTRAAIVGARPAPAADLFEYVYAQITPLLARERNEVARILHEQEES